MSASESSSSSATLYRDRIDAAVVGHVAAKARLAEVLHGFAERAKPLHLLLLGPPGCGKGTLGRALCAGVAPLPSLYVEHADDLTTAFSTPPPARTLIFIKNVDRLCRDPKTLESWTAAAGRAGSTVIASAALSVTAVGLELLFDAVVELEALTKREIEGALLHPNGLVMQVLGQSAKRGLGVIFLPEAKRAIADAAAVSGRGMNFLRAFSAALSRALPPTQRGDWLLDREVANSILRDLDAA